MDTHSIVRVKKQRANEPRKAWRQKSHPRAASVKEVQVIDWVDLHSIVHGKGNLIMREKGERDAMDAMNGMELKTVCAERNPWAAQEGMCWIVLLYLVTQSWETLEM